MNDQPNSNEIDAKDPRVARREKMRQIEELGLDPWGSRFDDRSLISECQARQSDIQWSRKDGEVVALPDLTAEGFDFRQWKSENGPGEQTGPTVRVAGRIMLSRDKGKLIFLTLRDWTGEIQIFVGKNHFTHRRKIRRIEQRYYRRKKIKKAKITSPLQACAS